MVGNGIVDREEKGDLRREVSRSRPVSSYLVLETFLTKQTECSSGVSRDPWRDLEGPDKQNGMSL